MFVFAHIIAELWVAPAFAPSSPPSSLLVGFVEATLLFLGSFRINTNLDLNGLSHDSAVRRDYLNDPLTHGLASLLLRKMLIGLSRLTPQLGIFWRWGKVGYVMSANCWVITWCCSMAQQTSSQAIPQHYPSRIGATLNGWVSTAAFMNCIVTIRSL